MGGGQTKIESAAGLNWPMANNRRSESIFFHLSFGAITSFKFLIIGEKVI